MSENFNAIYTKAGATFADGNAAYADKNQFYPPELTQQVESCYNQMIEDGILMEPVSHVWDQENSQLIVVKLVTSKEAYQAAVTFSNEDVVSYSEQAGWTFVAPV